MSLRKSFPLDEDILHHVFDYLPDFSSLLSVLLVSKSTHAVFDNRPNSITCAVAENQFGPILPHALRVIRLEERKHAYCKAHPYELDDLPKEEHSSSEVITSSDACRLCKNSRVVAELEGLFSWRYKDRTSNSSCLSNSESFRFRRAVYRYWAYQIIFGYELEDRNEDELYVLEEEMESNRHDRASFLCTFPSQEVVEIAKAVDFLSSTVFWAATAVGQYHTDFVNFIVACGPRLVLDCYKKHDLPSWDMDGPDSDFVSDAITDSFRIRGFPSSWEQTEVALVDHINGSGDRCDRCHTVKGLDLWNRTNYSYLKGRIRDFTTHFPKYLCYNGWERLTAELHMIDPKFSSASMMHDIFEMAESVGWNEDDWLCFGCVQLLLEERLMQWWIEQKRKDGLPFEGDCWFGYKCREQMNDEGHARDFNHLCQPTREQPPAPEGSYV
ncbi:hypothetical protein JAAARDRAFT_203719 [Jaapia argillacea MUCL 33604]|uniref:F-box domain-containing protein n=1 Tax=Jaapia argillacea MUCL 33604 TaxID=933084 RepID=A0A067QGI4_9AGAM|nr:hypothetical protein JAAARDRAFT_203719 [Jaapia argillacea MUCL 33604]